MRMLVVQHNDVEAPGYIADWARKHHYDVQVVRPDQGDSLNQWRSEQIDFLVIMGGNQGVHDSIRWIPAERHLIRRVDNAKRPILGICLGAQQIAMAFGALVTPQMTPEIGWLPVQESDQNPFDVPDQLVTLHWHGDQFTLPVDSRRLFKTKLDVNQGFVLHHRVVGLQFHPEVKPAEVKQLTKADHQFIAKSDAPNMVQQTADQINQHEVPQADREMLVTILDRISGVQK